MRERRRLEHSAPAGSSSIEPSASARQIVGGALERREGGAARLVGKRDGDLGAGGERLEQRPLGAAEILESVDEYRRAVPGVELACERLGRVAALELAVPEAEPVELLAVGRVELGELAVELRRLDERRLELGHGRAERVREPGEARRAAEPAGRASTTPPEQQRRCASADDAAEVAVRARDPLEEVVERADRRRPSSAPGRAQQIALDAVDLRPVRHDQKRIRVERGNVAIEQAGDLAGVRRADEQSQRHGPS